MQGLFVLCFCVAVAAAQHATMPGYVGPELHLKTGYVEVDEGLIFYLHVSLTPTPRRVAFWYQGGPGGSSMLGLFAELGPYSIVNNSYVAYREQNWLLDETAYVFVDNPACVGFSTFAEGSDPKSACNSSDWRSARANAVVVPKIRERLGYEKVPFWISGESWSGVYTPMLSALLVHNDAVREHFEGFLVGNPVVLCYEASDPVDQAVGDTYTNFMQLYWNGYVTQELMEAWYDEDCSSASHRAGEFKKACFEIFKEASKPSLLGADFEPDDRFADSCTGNGTLAFAESICDDGVDNTIFGIFGRYIAQPHVQHALNARVAFSSTEKYFDYTADAGSMLPFYATVMEEKPGAKIVVFSGLSDVYTVPFSFTMPCLYKLLNMKNGLAPLPKSTSWRTWNVNGHTSGHWEAYGTNSEFIYATVRGAGHESMLYSPLQMREFWRRIVTQGDLTDPAEHKPRRRTIPSSVQRQRELLRKYVLDR